MALPPKQSLFDKVTMWFMYLNYPQRIAIYFSLMMTLDIPFFFMRLNSDASWKDFLSPPVAIHLSPPVAIHLSPLGVILLTIATAIVIDWNMRKTRLEYRQKQEIIKQGHKTVVTVQISRRNSYFSKEVTYYLSVPNKLGENWIFKLKNIAPELVGGNYSAEIYFSSGVESPTLILIGQRSLLLGSPETEGVPPKRSIDQVPIVPFFLMGASFISLGLVEIANILAGHTSTKHSDNDLVFFIAFILSGIVLVLIGYLKLSKFIQDSRKRDKESDCPPKRLITQLITLGDAVSTVILFFISAFFIYHAGALGFIVFIVVGIVFALAYFKR
jgi:hypothetical protein